MLKRRPKSLPLPDILSSGSSDSGLDSDALSIYSPTEESAKSCSSTETRFQFGAELPMKDRMNNLQDALGWIRDELTLMKTQDKQLAKTMIEIRSKIQKTKLEMEALRDTGYDSDELETKGKKEDNVMNSQADITSLNDFPVNGDNFDKNKRATWAV